MKEAEPETNSTDDHGKSTILGKLSTSRALSVIAVLAVLCLVLLAAFLAVLDVVDFREVVEITQSIFTIVAIIAGGLFAWHKWQEFRESEPHLTITHEVSHRPVGESYVHIAVTAVLHNSSKVHIELREGLYWLQQVTPVSDEDLEALYAEVFADGEQTAIQWPTLEQVRRNWEKNETIIEPDESHPETCEFIVSKEVKSVVIYTYFHNSRFSPGAQAAEGWHTTTVHDIMEA